MIQRAVEAAGIPTVGLANLRHVVQRMKYPRTAIVKFPRGATVGRAGDVTGQTAVLRDALALLETATEPGQIADLPYSWSGGEEG